MHTFWIWERKKNYISNEFKRKLFVWQSDTHTQKRANEISLLKLNHLQKKENLLKILFGVHIRWSCINWQKVTTKNSENE